MQGEFSTKYNESLRNLVRSIVQRAQGVLLWVKLVVRKIVEGVCEGDTVDELTTLLSTIELRD